MTLSDQIDAARGRIHNLETERAALEAQPRSRQQVPEFVRDGVRDVESAAASGTLLTLERLAAGQPADLLTVTASAMTHHGPVLVTVDLLPVMVRLLGVATVRRALLVGIDSLPEGLEPAARNHRLQPLTSELHDLQTREESLIRDAAIAGQDIPRRSNADPAYVLASIVDP